MARGTITKKLVIFNILKTLTVLLLTALILLLALTAAFFVVARGPSGEASARLAATLAESGSLFGSLFYTYDELDAALHYTPPSISSSSVTPSGNTLTSAVTPISGRYWDGYVITGISPEQLKMTAASDVAVNATLSLGIDAMIDAVYTDDLLTYVGDENSVFCFCAMGKNGSLSVGAGDVYTAVNSDFLWALEADRALVINSTPLTDLGGGYATRAAMGQTADGGIVLIFAQGKAGYPSGITYDELAALMFEKGAVCASALDSNGDFSFGNTKTANDGYAIWTFDQGGETNG